MNNPIFPTNKTSTSTGRNTLLDIKKKNTCHLTFEAFHTWQSYRTTVSSRQTVWGHRELVYILSYIFRIHVTHSFGRDAKSSDLVVNEKLWRWFKMDIRVSAFETKQCGLKEANSLFPNVCSDKVRWCSEGVAEADSPIKAGLCSKICCKTTTETGTICLMHLIHTYIIWIRFSFWHYWHCVIWIMTPWGNSKPEERFTSEHFQSNGQKKPVVQFSGLPSPARRDGALDYLPHHSLPGVLNWNMDCVSFSSNPFISIPH